MVISVHLNYKKLVPIKGKINSREIEFMIKNAPDYLETLTNFDENSNRALRNAVSLYVDYDNPDDAFQTVAHDFYRYDTKSYIQNMIKLGYDGHFSAKINSSVSSIFYDDKETHFIVFNPVIIQIIDAEPVKNELSEILKEEINKVIKNK